MSEENARPDWYPHPERPEEEWYWDGTEWTDSRWAEWHRKRRLRSPAEFLQVEFRVAFDGGWQADFDSLAEAVDWARKVSLTGRETWVIERHGLSHRFRAGFPEERAKELEEAWRVWRSRGGGA